MHFKSHMEIQGYTERQSDIVHVEAGVISPVALMVV
jgi:hypothetical protein